MFVSSVHTSSSSSHCSHLSIHTPFTHTHTSLSAKHTLTSSTTPSSPKTEQLLPIEENVLLCFSWVNVLTSNTMSKNVNDWKWIDPSTLLRFDDHLRQTVCELGRSCPLFFREDTSAHWRCLVMLLPTEQRHYHPYCEHQHQQHCHDHENGQVCPTRRQVPLSIISFSLFYSLFLLIFFFFSNRSRHHSASSRQCCC